MKSEAKPPQPGETWIHERHGAVRIVRAWSERECVCELLGRSNRRVLLMNALMQKAPASAFNESMGPSAGCEVSNRLTYIDHGRKTPKFIDGEEIS